MCSTYAIASGGLLLALLACCFTGLLQYRRVLAHLARVHPPVFRSLGRPQVVTVEGAASDAAAFRFIVSKSYVALKDSELNSICARVRALLVVVVLLLVAAIGLQALPGTNLPFMGIEFLFRGRMAS